MKNVSRIIATLYKLYSFFDTVYFSNIEKNKDLKKK